MATSGDVAFLEPDGFQGTFSFRPDNAEKASRNATLKEDALRWEESVAFRDRKACGNERRPSARRVI